ncbi:MAG: hypothetical protein COV32_01870 [Candidatus Yonathbacteria bacterium CG10_big_fil_rev_8_21_14_0_10_43_136]|uniref:Nucleotidyl transferase domain-containing protein n=1 Tax=Candidatus Yonathbacteria bacterium CG_4_10_14_0_8_um_filter_43_17 TaxID=1975099 RepID=A0A2M7Q6F0_9BACT|nr:MAG: hypothetical protein COW60_00150 [Candidatus Yonathbacteria bacterium CG17_big_fil_post_rev_8_21_14_2_50_43_9]PIR40725.1 MAG: hypothetical protein COV32_01870 [Candidatus Yonathbacteria bacterium CG10_big_fil_rev_8_21_14_0_10_43_136]PIX56992.1 MAG: hypothetical protein COZ48_02940 [Candidatus Yonathbacteria bacterium CG_4_10_14_3_um_filter_43_12]PIY58769.1 MAG: hypothetical protein COY98_00250 [Candidatus Yonathbacteria bacterium CG_4_10_14_0_8_um_filter_43_17]PJC22531.1 MAG: hypothetic
MKAVIFATGGGKRMHPSTIERPKPFVEVLGKPLIQHILEVPPEAVGEVVILVGYKREMMRDFLWDEFMEKMVTYVEQDEPLGTARALPFANRILKTRKNFF